MAARTKKTLITTVDVTEDAQQVGDDGNADAANEPAPAAEATTAGPVITLDAASTLQHVVKLYEKLKQSYAANDALEINAAHVTSIDTASLQLLVALKKDAVKQQKSVIFTEPSRRFIESAGLLGLLEILDIDV